MSDNTPPRTIAEFNRITSQLDGAEDNLAYALSQMSGLACTLERELAAAQAENEKLQEALKWSLKNGVVYHRTYDTDEVFFSDAGCGCCSSLTEPPPHLQEMILKIARQEKT
jgi:hypothetical protein